MLWKLLNHMQSMLLFIYEGHFIKSFHSLTHDKTCLAFGLSVGLTRKYSFRILQPKTHEYQNRINCQGTITFKKL